ncbi:hypothetical protein [Cupriavidus sp. D39]|uniref:hypothetical protein n=1 Tax=Cupriavidus sp. D39 TaxID=2997877 RepID=UPI00226FC11A|nr:hypothetical protein [Cupriavidus sp. D39]MCY0854984.1 hypothetical protein [Cupriavidus sp. D39]
MEEIVSLPVNDGLLQIFNVDHGQCALLTMPAFGGIQRVLIDCGHSVNFMGTPWHPGKHLQAAGVKWLDLLVCTNYDEDHASGFPDLNRRNIGIGCVLGNPTVSPETIVHLKFRRREQPECDLHAGYIGIGVQSLPPFHPNSCLHPRKSSPHHTSKPTKNQSCQKARLLIGGLAGYPPLRAALADYLRTARGVRCEPEQIIITAGIHPSLQLITHLL